MEEVRRLCLHQVGKNDSLGHGRSLQATQILYAFGYHLYCCFLLWRRRRCHHRATLQGEVLGRSPWRGGTFNETNVLLWTLEGNERRSPCTHEVKSLALAILLHADIGYKRCRKLMTEYSLFARDTGTIFNNNSSLWFSLLSRKA